MPTTLAVNAMGTRFELVLDGDDPHALRAVGEMALREVTECHTRFNLFDPGSWLNTISRRASEEAVELDELTFELLDTCRQVHLESMGAFDVTVAPLMDATGLHRAGGASTADEIQHARSRVGMRHVVLDHDNKTVRFTRPGVALDLGAVAKGFAIDLAIDLLREHGVTRALLHGGTSTAAAIGAPPTQDGWRIQVHQDGPPIELKDNALSVSAPTGRTTESKGQTIGHVLDPRTGESAMALPFAAAICQSARFADAWSTALLVLGNRPDGMPNDLQAVFPDDEAVTTNRIKPNLESVTL